MLMYFKKQLMTYKANEALSISWYFLPVWRVNSTNFKHILIVPAVFRSNTFVYSSAGSILEPLGVIRRQKSRSWKQKRLLQNKCILSISHTMLQRMWIEHHR